MCFTEAHFYQEFKFKILILVLLDIGSAHPCFVKPLSFGKIAMLLFSSCPSVTCLFSLFFLVERSREGVFPLRVIWIRSAAGSSWITWRHWRIKVTPHCLFLSVSCNPGKSSKSHRWAASDPQPIIICGYHFPFACLHAMSHRDSESECQYRDRN